MPSDTLSGVQSFLGPLQRDPTARLRLVHENGAVVADRVEAALDSASRRKGLLGRDGLPPRTAIVIAPCKAVHTFFMRFPIDVIFVARDGRVTKIRRGMTAWRIAGSWGAFATIEMAAGSADEAHVQIGSRLALR